MKVLLRDTATGMFFRDSEERTFDPRQATTFLRGATALQFVAEHQLQGVELVFCFEDPRYNLNFPTSQSPAFPRRPLLQG
jgi:hypothetical protein